jgi:hypothetical protein
MFSHVTLLYLSMFVDKLFVIQYQAKIVVNGEISITLFD